jgi:hypothetical protein
VNSRLTDLILFDSPKLVKMATELSHITWEIIPVIFLMAVIGKYFTDMDWKSLLKKLFISSLLLTFFTGFHKEAVFTSIKLAEDTILKRSKVSIDLFKLSKPEKQKVQKIKKNIEKRDKNLYESIKSVPEALFSYGASLAEEITTGVGYVLPLLVDLFAWVAFLLIKIVFSGVFHLTYVFTGLVALLYLFDFGDKALKGMLISSVWCMIFPFVLCASIFFLGSTVGEIDSSGRGLMNLALTIISSTFFIFTPVITLKLISGLGVVEGITEWGAKVGMGAVALGGAFAFAGLKSKASSAKSIYADNADGIRSRTPLSLDEAQGGFIKGQRSNLSMGERIILGADTFMRPVVNGKRNRATKYAAKRAIKNGADPSSQMPFDSIANVDPKRNIADRGNQILSKASFGESQKVDSQSAPYFGGSFNSIPKNENGNNSNLARPRISNDLRTDPFTGAPIKRSVDPLTPYFGNLPVQKSFRRDSNDHNRSLMNSKFQGSASNQWIRNDFKKVPMPNKNFDATEALLGKNYSKYKLENKETY